MRLRASALVLFLVLLVSVHAAAAPPACDIKTGGMGRRIVVRYEIDAELDPHGRTITGTATMHFDNDATKPLEEVVLVLYPNRFAIEDPGINDLNRPFVYPRERFVPGGMKVEAIEIAESARTKPRGPLASQLPVAVAAERIEAIDVWSGTLLRARLATPVAPGRALHVRVRFQTLLPERYGPFGVAAGRVAALDGWFPVLVALRADGAWDPHLPPPTSTVSGRLRVPSSYTVAFGSQVVAADHGGEIDLGLGADPASLLANEDYRGAHRDVEGATVVFMELPPPRAFNFPPRKPHAERVLDTVARMLRERPCGVPPPRVPLLVVEAPLRLELTAPAGSHVAIVSDRVLRVHRLLREFHERELATALYAALLRDDVYARETAADAPWVLEGVASELADRYVAAAHPRHRTVYDWIGIFDVFAIVDRFETAPKIPFARAFFPESRHASELRDGFESFARDRPPGRTIFTKLRNAIGEDAYRTHIDQYLSGSVPFRQVVSTGLPERMDWLFTEWTQPYPQQLNYALEADLNREPGTPATLVDATATPAGDALGRYRHRLSIARTSSRPIREAVEVELRGADGERWQWIWNESAPRAVLEVDTPWRARRAEIDPQRRLLEDTRVDNTRPPRLQVVLDSADVTVTSSEFGVSGLFVARRRYDYTKDVGLVGFFSDRSVGLHVGPRLHFGPANDPTSYRHNLYGFYTFAALRGDFRDDSRPGFATDGTLGGIGLRYDYTDEFAFDNPAATNKLRLFADWYSSALGSSFDYVDFGMRASVVRPLFTPRTLVALQVMNAFSTPIGSDHVPNQGRYSLGGDLAIRGIPVDERLGENLALVRAEIRQRLPFEVDHNLFDLVVVRRPQIRFFVDAGRVEDRRSSLYRISDFAVGVGVAAAMIYDFMGFYPAVAYVAVAQRVDRFDGVDNDVQFLFGTRQAF